MPLKLYYKINQIAEKLMETHYSAIEETEDEEYTEVLSEDVEKTENVEINANSEVVENQEKFVAEDTENGDNI